MADADTTELTCPICKNDLDSSRSMPVRAQGCAHIFCRECLTTWHARAIRTLLLRDYDDYETASIGGCPICRSGASFTADEHRRCNSIIPVRALTRIETRCVGSGCAVDIRNSEYMLCPCGHALCLRCRGNFTWVNENCPTCNAPILGVVENQAITASADVAATAAAAADAAAASADAASADAASAAADAAADADADADAGADADAAEYRAHASSASAAADAAEYRAYASRASAEISASTRHYHGDHALPTFSNYNDLMQFMQNCSMRYALMSSADALRLFLQHEGDELRLYGAMDRDDERSPFHSNVKLWNVQERAVWNLLLDILVRIALYHRDLQILYIFDMPTQLRELCYTMCLRVHKLLRARRQRGLSLPPFYTRVPCTGYFSWRYTAYDVDSAMKWFRYMWNPRAPALEPGPERAEPPRAPAFEPWITTDILVRILNDSNASMQCTYALRELVEKQWRWQWIMHHTGSSYTARTQASEEEYCEEDSAESDDGHDSRDGSHDGGDGRTRLY